ncbi:hypothetical protein RRG08_038242 [Elysia crispata]|uniref:Uncharacterized protein n=1 Tax=Elysia crispata TaxID=231223 RepID=A0AAE1AP66_9GAST|nr:hypothetical protein RRG08_038242 [Elysia crispata]
MIVSTLSNVSISSLSAIDMIVSTLSNVSISSLSAIDMIVSTLSNVSISSLSAIDMIVSNSPIYDAKPTVSHLWWETKDQEVDARTTGFRQQSGLATFKIIPEGQAILIPVLIGFSGRELRAGARRVSTDKPRSGRARVSTTIARYLEQVITEGHQVLPALQASRASHITTEMEICSAVHASTSAIL